MKYILILVMSVMLFSCQKLLDIEQNTRVTTGTAWSTENSAKANAIGMYHLMRSAFSQGFVYWGEYRNGMWGPGRIIGSQEPFSTTFTSTMNSSNAMSNWANVYTTINQANLVIAYLPDVPFASETEKNEVLAGAYFVRAFCYYWIARIWGDAPLELTPYESISGEEYEGRAPVADVFAQVEADIAQARELIPSSAVSKSMVSYAGVEMLAADYFLWKYKVLNGTESDLNVAETAVSNVLAANYDLEPVFAHVFNNNDNREVIFKWPYIKDEYEGGYPFDYLYNAINIDPEFHENPVPIYTLRQQWVNLTMDYVEYLYEDPTDVRAAVSYGYLGSNMANGWVNKFPGSLIESTRFLDSDINVYRLADAILFDAEIKLARRNIGDAQTALNRIAQRAYGVDGYYNGLTTEESVKKAIVAERKKEFVAEGRLWWDFIRLGVVFDESVWLHGRENDRNVLLWPVHNSSMNSNPNIKQTEGY